jgi:hypothetical protein
MWILFDISKPVNPFLLRMPRLPAVSQSASLKKEQERTRTSKHEIMIPQAGAIFAVRGNIPANNAPTPSIRITRNSRGILLIVFVAGSDMTKLCLRVFKTSNGDVIIAAVVPLTAPLMNATQVPDRPRLAKALFPPS